MSELALKAFICNFIHNNDVCYFYDLKRRFRLSGREDLIYILENDIHFSLRVKEFLLKRRLGGC